MIGEGKSVKQMSCEGLEGWHGRKNHALRRKRGRSFIRNESNKQESRMRI